MPKSKNVNIQKYILKKTLHLGYVRQSYAMGTVIEHNEAENTLTIDGTTFNTTKDLDILKNHNWVEKYSIQAKNEILQKPEVVNQNVSIRKENTGQQKLVVVESDQDLNEDINISYTKKAKKEAKKAESLEVIKGDEPVETPEQRLARLQSEPAKMQVVEDDGSLGRESGKGPALNAGSVKVLTAEQHAALREEALRKAQEKKESLKIKEEDLHFQTPEQAASGNEQFIKADFEPVPSSVVEETGVKVVKARKGKSKVAKVNTSE